MNQIADDLGRYRLQCIAPKERRRESARERESEKKKESEKDQESEKKKEE